MLDMDQKDKVFFDLFFQDKDIRGDHGIVERAVNINGLALRYASSDLKNDRAIVLAAVRKNGGALWFASERLKGDPEIVLAAVKESGWALECASEELRGDREIVLAAVSKNGRALQFASKALRGDRKIVLAAMKEDLFACRYSLLGHEETKALLKEISLEKYVSPGELKGISVFDRILKDDSIIVREQNERTLSKIISYFSLRDASTFSELTKETNKLMKPDLGKVSKRITFKEC